MLTKYIFFGYLNSEEIPCALNRLPLLRQIVVFQRDPSTGSLSSPVTVKVGDETYISGVIAGMTQSGSTTSSTDRLFVSMAASNNDGGIAVFKLECTGPAPTEGICVTYVEVLVVPQVF